MKNYYEILGISQNADYNEIKKAYRNLTKKFHPDVNKNSKNIKIFEEINIAYKTLIDPEKRKNYDNILKNSLLKENKIFHFIEYYKKLFSFDFLKRLFNNKKLHKTNNYYNNMTSEELLKNILFSNNKYVQIHSVKALLNKNYKYLIYDLFRLLYSNINEDVKITIVEGLIKISDQKIINFLKDLYNLEKSIKIKLYIKKYLKI